MKTKLPLTTLEVSRILGVSKIRVSQFAQQGRLKPFKLGPINVFDADEVARFAKIPRPAGKQKKP